MTWILKSWVIAGVVYYTRTEQHGTNQNSMMNVGGAHETLLRAKYLIEIKVMIAVGGVKHFLQQ